MSAASSPQVVAINQPSAEAAPALWRFIYKSRPDAEEQAFRQHYLDNDIRQVTTITFFAVAFMLVLSAIDLASQEMRPDLMIGLGIRTGFVVLGFALIVLVNKVRRAITIDLAAIVYTTVISLGIFVFHTTTDVGILRIAIVLTFYIFVVHLTYPTYALYISIPVTSLIIADSYMMFRSTVPEFVENRDVVLAALITAQIIALIGSAHLQRSRYHIFTAMRKIRTLSGLLPICASCKKIRNDHGFYQQIELYVREHSHAEFTHGICPECAEKFYEVTRANARRLG